MTDSAPQYPLTVEGLPHSPDALATWRSVEGAEWLIRHRPTLHVYPVIRDGLDIKRRLITIPTEQALHAVLGSLWFHATREMQAGETLGRYRAILRRGYALVAAAAGMPPAPDQDG